MKIVRKENKPEDLEWYRESLVEKNSSRLKTLIFFVLCVMLIFATVAYGAVDIWATASLSVLSCLILLLWFTDSFLKKEFVFNTNLLQIPVLGLILIGFIQLLPLRGELEPNLLSIPAAQTLSLDPYATRFFIILLFINLIFFAAALTFVDDLKKIRRVTFTIILFGSLMAFFGVIQSLTTNSILGIRVSPGAIPFATFVNRHHFGAFMNMTIGLTLGLLFGGATKKDKRLLLIIALILMGIALIFTSSRGAMLSLFAVVGLVVLINVLGVNSDRNLDEFDEKPSKSRRNFLFIGGGLGLILVLFGSVLLLGGDQSLTRGIGLSNEADISTGRSHFWYVTLQIIKNNFILGTGLDSFGVAFPKYDTWNGSTFRLEQAHNDYLQILSDAGIFGFICVAAFIYLLFKQSWRVISNSTDTFRKNVSVGALAGCFGIIIHSFFDFPLRTSSNGLFFLMLATLATVSIKDSGSSIRKKRKRTKIRLSENQES